MVKQDIVDRILTRIDITKVKAEEAVECVLQCLRQAIKRGERIELRGFGVFILRPRKTGIGRNPRSGKEVAIRPGKTVRFKPSKFIKDVSSQQTTNP